MRQWLCRSGTSLNEATRPLTQIVALYTGADQFVVRTQNPMQPFRVSRHQPTEPETILALVA